MNWIKRNLMFLGLIAGFVVLLAGSSFLLMKKIEERKAVEASLEQKKQEREALRNRKPFPSRENYDVMMKNVVQLEEVSQGLLELLEGKRLEFGMISGPQCQAEILQSCRRMESVLSAAGVKFPAKSQFGFEQYAKFPPEADLTPLIQTQIKILEEIMGMVAKAQFREVVTVRRVESDASSKSPGTVPPGRSPIVSLGSQWVYFDSPDFPYAVMPFEFVFRCDIEKLRIFLNLLSRSSFPLVPRILKITNDKPEPTTAAKAGGSATAKESQEIKVFKALTTEEIDASPYVFGEEGLTFSVRIDWFDFHREKSESNTEPH